MLPFGVLAQRRPSAACVLKGLWFPGPRGLTETREASGR